MISPAQTPLYEIKANLFKALAHPARIRVLELLSAAPDNSAPVSYLLAETGLEASHLSQHLAVLRRCGLIEARRAGRMVLNTRTALGHALLNATDTGHRKSR